LDHLLQRDDHVGLPDVVYLQFGFLLWLAVATAALCLVLTRRAARVSAFLDVRRRLVAESMQADERTNNSTRCANAFPTPPST
jgi:two-component system NarL family sensor kinase